MKIVVGLDLLYLPRFKASLKRGGEIFLRRIFKEEEMTQSKAGPRANLEHLAGIFAAKEAVIKALSLPTDSWQEIHVKYSPDGAPKIEILNPKSLIISHCLSISHDGNYVIAEFVAILEE